MCSVLFSAIEPQRKVVQSGAPVIEEQKTRNLLKHRLEVLTCMFVPAIRVARHMKLPLDALIEIVETAYVLEHQRAGFSFTQVAARIQRSRRSVATIAARAKSDFAGATTSSFAAMRTEALRAVGHELQTRGHAEEHQVLSRIPRGERDRVEQTLNALVEEGLLREVFRKEQRFFEPLQALVADVGPSDDRKLWGLKNVLSGFSALVMNTFFSARRRDAPKGSAKIWSFSASPSTFAQIQETLHALVLERAVQADEEATNHKHDVQVFVGCTPSIPELMEQ